QIEVKEVATLPDQEVKVRLTGAACIDLRVHLVKPRGPHERGLRIIYERRLEPRLTQDSVPYALFKGRFLVHCEQEIANSLYDCSCDTTGKTSEAATSASESIAA